ncbi:MAG TPA: hypothetical protein VLK33_06170, partial [Terriglobales bacterium]|nr:hypothetical protein [Terriglobales bacterium]
MAIDSKHADLQSLRIDRSAPPEDSEPSSLAKRIIVIGIAVVVLLSLSALAYRLFSSDAPEVETARATAETSGNVEAGT